AYLAAVNFDLAVAARVYVGRATDSHIPRRVVRQYRACPPADGAVALLDLDFLRRLGNFHPHRPAMACCLDHLWFLSRCEWKHSNSRSPCRHASRWLA